MSAKGDARPERQSSWANSASTPQRRWGVGARRYAALAFASFVLLHLGCEAYRAHTDGAIPEPGMEVRPAFVAAALLLVWLPFAAFLGGELARWRSRSPTSHGQERALAAVEPVALAALALFALVHGAGIAWPILTGTWADTDVRSELVAALSGTHAGVPLQAIGYLTAVGASSFYAARQTLKVFSPTRTARRGIVALGVLAYLLGSYAVIRCASGTLLP